MFFTEILDTRGGEYMIYDAKTFDEYIAQLPDDMFPLILIWAKAASVLRTWIIFRTG